MEIKGCPDCGYKADYPYLFRDNALFLDDIIVRQPVYAQCGRCGWRTNSHDNVKECLDEWNNTYLYGDGDGPRL